MTFTAVTNASFHTIFFSKNNPLALFDLHSTSYYCPQDTTKLDQPSLPLHYVDSFPSCHTMSTLLSSFIPPIPFSATPVPKDTKDPYTWLELDDTCLLMTGRLLKRPLTCPLP